MGELSRLKIARARVETTSVSGMSRASVDSMSGCFQHARVKENAFEQLHAANCRGLLCLGSAQHARLVATCSGFACWPSQVVRKILQKSGRTLRGQT